MQERKSAKVREKRGEAREAYRELEEAEEAHENLRQCAPPAMEAEQGKREWHDRCRAAVTEGAEAGYGEHPPGEGDAGGDGGAAEGPKGNRGDGMVGRAAPLILNQGTEFILHKESRRISLFTFNWYFYYTRVIPM